MPKFKVNIVAQETYEIEVDAIDELDAEEKAIDEAKKMFSENGIVNPEFLTDLVDEVDDNPGSNNVFLNNLKTITK